MNFLERNIKIYADFGETALTYTTKDASKLSLKDFIQQVTVKMQNKDYFLLEIHEDQETDLPRKSLLSKIDHRRFIRKFFPDCEFTAEYIIGYRCGYLISRLSNSDLLMENLR